MNPDLNHAKRTCDQRIDQVLRRLGSVTPAAGIEDRISARLVREHSRSQAATTGRVRFFGVPRFAIGVAAGAFACVAIVAGSVNHSRRIQPTMPGVGLQPMSSGIGAAGAEHRAERPVSPSPAGRPRSVHHLSEGRAVISSQSQKPAGVVVPKNPSPAP
jgi:hypothetical protein